MGDSDPLYRIKGRPAPLFQFQGGLLAMKADVAWAISTGLTGSNAPAPIIAIIDTGIDYTHEDLKSLTRKGAKNA